MINFNTDHLYSLLKAFYTLTKLKVVVFDENYMEIISFPSGDSRFCSHVKKELGQESKCQLCVKRFCENCKAKKDLYINYCHVGLTEAVFPIVDSNDIVLGYIMFGQTSPTPNFNALKKHIRKTFHDSRIFSAEAEKYLKEIQLRSIDEIISASEILKTIAGYITMNQFIVKKTNYLILDLNNYIDQHVHENITVNDICKNIFISKTTLYRILKKENCENINTLITNKKIALCEKLLSTTDLSINEIAKKLGFKESNYLSKLFKKKTGLIPSDYRKKFKIQL